MSSFLKILSDKIQKNNDEQARNQAFDYFQQSQQPYDDLFQHLLTSTNTHQSNTQLITCLIQAFLQWKQDKSNRNIPVPAYDINLIEEFILKNLPVAILPDFCEIFAVSKEFVLFLLRDLFQNPKTPPIAYKRALYIVVKFQFQFEFYPNELLLPLILESKDQLIHIFLDNNRRVEELLLDLLNHLFDNGGKRQRDILAREYAMVNVNINKKALGKLAVRFWNSLGQNQTSRYPNLASLQNRRALGYLINVKYTGNSDEKSMSDEAWNEIVEVR